MNPIEEIFRTAYLPLYPRLYATAFGLLADGDDAADAVQETMVKIWKSGQALASVHSPEAYSFKILRSTAIDMLRRRSHEGSLPDGKEPDEAVELPEPDTAEFLVRAIESLPEGQREVVRLSAFEDRPPDEIAEITGHTPANVRQLLCRGRKKIREIYNKYLVS